MRSLKKDKKNLYIAKRLPSVPILDENGFQTGEYAKVYDDLIPLNLNAKPVTDKIEQQMFGEDLEHILKITYSSFGSNNVIISQYDAVWFEIEPNGVLIDSDPNNPMNNNYFVTKTINLGNQNAAFIKKIAGEPQ